jgi:glycosyltransferase involved in cell wall biosynthesis
MRIAVNTRFLLPHKMEGFGWFTYETVKRMVLAHPEHEFIFFFDRQFDPKFIFAKNVEGVVLNPPARHPILFKIWFNYAVTKALEKYRADVFFSPDGYLSMRTDVPQIGVIHDLNFEHYPQDLPRSARNYLRRYFPKFAQKARQLITVSEFSKQDIIKTYGIDEARIAVAYNGASEIFRPLAAGEKQKTRESFTKGEDYFVFVGAIHPRKNIQRLLEAFNAFKDQSGSGTKLLVVGENLWRSKKMKTVLLHPDIMFTGHQPIEMLAKIIASAKALAFVSYFEGFGIPLVEAMKAGCPILSGNLTSLPEVAGDAAIYCDPMNVTSIKDGLVKLDSDAALRTDLIEKGKTRANQFSWDFTAQKTWEVIESVIKK